MKNRYQIIVRDKKTGVDQDLDYFLDNQIDEVQKTIKQINKKVTFLAHVAQCKQVDEF